MIGIALIPSHVLALVDRLDSISVPLDLGEVDLERLDEDHADPHHA